MERGGLPWIYSVCGKGNIIDECKTCPTVSRLSRGTNETRTDLIINPSANS